MDDEEQVAPVFAMVYTDFFKRDAQIYALGDIRFNKPKSLKAVGYTLVLIFLYSFPMIMLIGANRLIANVVWFAIVFGPPVLIGSVMSKPLFHNKPLLKDIASIWKYNNQAKTYTDLRSYDLKGKPVEITMTLWLGDSDDDYVNGEPVALMSKDQQKSVAKQQRKEKKALKKRRR